VQKRALRWSEGVCVIEGPDLVEAALAARAHFEALYVDVEALARPPLAALVERASDEGVRVVGLAGATFARVADAATPQGVMASVYLPVVGVSEVASDGLVLVAHDLHDPGNAGTIIRSAEAAGARGVIFTGQSVDPCNPKALRASAGAIFQIPVAVGELDTVLEYFSRRGATTWATVLTSETDIRDVDLSGANVVVIGSEADGLDPAAIAACAGTFRIAMAGASESLNAGVAASLVAFRAMWQREGAAHAAPRPSLGGS
jgi:RNA methyltransferase, TrmH family